MRMGPGPEAEPELDPGDCCSGSGSGSGIVPPWPAGRESELGRVFQPPSGLSCYHRDHQGPADLAQGLITDPGPQGLDLWADFHHSHTKWWDKQEPVQTERERESESTGRSRPLSLALVGWHLLPLLPLLPLFILLSHTRAHTSSLTSPVLIRPGPTPAVMSSAARRKTRGVFGFCRPVLWGRRAESFSSAPHPSIPAHLLSPPLFGEKKKDTLLDSPSGPGCSPPRFLVLWGFYFSFLVSSSSGLFFCHWWSRIKKKKTFLKT